MPIRPDLRPLYGRDWRLVTRPRILERAKNACEQCRVPNHALILRVDRFPGWWFTQEGEIHNQAGELTGHFRGSELDEEIRPVRIVLTIAHLNQVSGDDRDENLAALCQWCHLHHDQKLHVEHSRITRLDRKDAARPLLAGNSKGSDNGRL